MRILVVDDEDELTRFLKKLLESQSHEVVVLKNGKEAVEQFETINPDMILMDVMMPVMDGLEATRLIRAKQSNKFIPILFLTAKDNETTLVQCLESGGDDFISKPFSHHVLNAKIAAFFRIVQLHQTVSEQNNQLRKIQQNSENERQIAEDIFSRVLYRGSYDKSIIHTLHKPADTFNGDMVLAVRSPRGGMNFLLGDFTGHGLGAALCSLPVVEIFSQMTYKGYNLKDIIREVNRKVSKYLPKGRFFAATFMHINGNEKILKIWNGGMPDIFIFNSGAGIRERVASKNLPLGILPANELSLELERFELEEGDRIFAYSDGLIEIRDIEGRYFSQDQLENFIIKNIHHANMVMALSDELQEVFEGKKFHDDISMLEIVCEYEKFVNAQSSMVQDCNIGNWQIDQKFDIATLKLVDPVPVLLTLIADIRELNHLRENIYTVATELFTNALEHGLLGLDSKMKKDKDGFADYYKEKEKRLNSVNKGYIRIKFSHTLNETGGLFEISVEDSGNGFDISQKLGSNPQLNVKEGRGLQLIKLFSDDLTFNEKGNQLSAVFKWHKH